mmetsp:Transcript_23789/g.31530  ORF Transcript_23789/g.31530 Transcript_23789/m.31530 type:complete len:119 (+) Transcript_23789:1161-1517(+)
MRNKAYLRTYVPPQIVREFKQSELRTYVCRAEIFQKKESLTDAKILKNAKYASCDDDDDDDESPPPLVPYPNSSTLLNHLHHLQQTPCGQKVGSLSNREHSSKTPSEHNHPHPQNIDN